MPADPNTAEIISSDAAVVSAAGGAFAAWAAFHSASHAKQSSMQAAEAERRLLARQVVATAHSVLADIDLANVLAQSYMGELSAHEVFTHAVGNSGGVELREKLKAQLEMLGGLRAEVESIRDEHHFLTSDRKSTRLNSSHLGI